MAELVLYGNELEPPFPFDLVLHQLSWLPSYLRKVTKPKELVALLNTILVFARARTATMNHKTDLFACKSLMLQLNSVLEKIGEEGLHHRMELVKRGRGLVFITCKKSPRFNWKTHLTHLDIGRNLDYSSAGHIFVHPLPPRGSIQFVERNSMRPLFCEMVLLEVLEDAEVKKGLMRFNSAKETMFNNVMHRLGLDYRFKWFLITPGRAEEAAAVMADVTLPSREWWEENCIFADGNGIPGLPCYHRYAGLNTKFEQYWPVIRHMYFFVKKYETTTCVDSDHEIILPQELWQAGEKLYAEVRDALETEMTSDDFDSFFESVKKSTNKFLEAVEQYLSGSGVSPLILRNYTTLKMDMFKALPRTIWEDIKMRLIYRWKLREPLRYSNVPYVPSSLGNEYRF